MVRLMAALVAVVFCVLTPPAATAAGPPASTAVAAGSPASSATGARASAPGWLLLSGHNHSHASNQYSHDPDHVPPYVAFNPAGIASISGLARSHGIDALVLTDHNTVRGCHDPHFRAAGPTWLCGEELTAGSAHTTVIFPHVPELLPGGGEPFHPYHMLKRFCTSKGCVEHRAGAMYNLPDEGMAAAIAEIQAKGGLVLMNHPMSGLPPRIASSIVPGLPLLRTLGSLAWPYRSSLGVEGVEIGIPGNSGQRAAVRYWDRLLGRGLRLTGVAGTDYHHEHPSPGETGVQNWVMALPIDREALLMEPDARRRVVESLGRGRAQVLANAGIVSRIDLELLAGGQRYEVGDVVDLGALAGVSKAGQAGTKAGPSGTKAPGRDAILAGNAPRGVVRVRVTAPRGGWLRLIRDGEVWGAPMPLPTAPAVTLSRTLPLNRPGYVRAEIYGMPGSTTSSDVLTNPIYWTRQVASVEAAVRQREIDVSWRVPPGQGAQLFLSAAGRVPYGPSDRHIVARITVPPGQAGRPVTFAVPNPGGWTVSVFPLNGVGELVNYRMPASVGVVVPGGAPLSAGQGTAPPVHGAE